eukprot:TRINITY_DN1836_c0_g1_i1.p1 TRINITY_DN1836_c0_g1~~TRINITY_DN1836_c0_g1_i1.p1  ORF type:complete len:638 (+),score=143.28 TRINITY_DN1836_c0_g1_i1:107-2020(+)
MGTVEFKFRSEMIGDHYGNYGDFSDGPKIRVIVRKRPLSKKEIARNDTDIIDVRDVSTVIVRELKQKVDLTKYVEEHVFSFDQAFDENSSNEALYCSAVRPIVSAAFAKAKVTCFAYGQTGSGKTFTMMGDPNRDNPVPGLYSLAAQDIFRFLERPEFRGLSAWVSFYEIYCGKLHDLLNDRALLHAREDARSNVNIVGLSEKRVTNVHSLLQLIEIGSGMRVTGQTGANLDSSRSHAILQVALKDPGERAHGKMSFIDLAGSERGADTVDQNKQTRIDGAEINKSLLALKECIRALDQDKKHTPFRGSKLTMVLKDSFVGNCRTVMIGNISPAQSNCEHTLNTLRYADRVKELKKPPSESQSNQLDALARQLMLPRQNTNAHRMPLEPTNGPNLFQLPPQMPPQMQVQMQMPQKRFGQQGNTGPAYMNVNLEAICQRQGGNSSLFGGDAMIEEKNESHFVQRVPSQPPQTGFRVQPPAKPVERGLFNPAPPMRNDHHYGAATMKPEDNLYLMSQRHEQLITVILKEEEETINAHRQHIDDVVEIVKQEMVLLNEVDKPGSDVDKYVECVDGLLAHKMMLIQQFRDRLSSFRAHLKQEEQLSQRFHEHRNEVLDVFDLQSSGIGNIQDDLRFIYPQQ